MHRLAGYAAPFNSWTTIHEPYLGTFRERIVPGAFTKTLAEDRGNIHVLLSHGRDMVVDTKPIAAIDELRENSRGLMYRARLFQGVPQLVREGLKERLYGASIGMAIERDSWVDNPKASVDNPDRLPERSLEVVRLREFSIVSRPAYKDATAELVDPDEAPRSEPVFTASEVRRVAAALAKELKSKRKATAPLFGLQGEGKPDWWLGPVAEARDESWRL